MTIKYHYKKEELIDGINPSQLGLEYTSVLRIELNGSRSFDSFEEELCMVCIEGEVDYICGEEKGQAVFKDMLYIPRRTKISLAAEKRAVIILYKAPSDLDAEFAHLRFKEIDKNPKTHKVYGKPETNCQRDVWNFIDDDFKACRLLMGMCQGEPGGWTAWPPHEHAEKREEVYVYFNMGEAFGVQLVYEDMDRPLSVALIQEGDLVSVPRGYHPSVGCPAGKISYIYCMVSKKAGDRSFMDLHIQEVYGDKFE